MHTIEATAVVTADHQLVVQSPVPDDVVPGKHAVLVTIDPARQTRGNGMPFFRSSYPIGLTTEDVTFRREDIYEDVDR
jgi:hypothetical protein